MALSLLLLGVWWLLRGWCHHSFAQHLNLLSTYYLRAVGSHAPAFRKENYVKTELHDIKGNLFIICLYVLSVCENRPDDRRTQYKWCFLKDNVKIVKQANECVLWEWHCSCPWSGGGSEDCEFLGCWWWSCSAWWLYGGAQLMKVHQTMLGALFCMYIRHQQREERRCLERSCNYRR